MRESYNVFVCESVLKEIREHAKPSPTEVGGVLLGDLYEDVGNIEVLGTVRAKHAISKEFKITFTAATWRGIKKEKRDKFPDKDILGWYHSHVGKDAQSGFTFADLDFHQKMFNKDWQVAIVYNAAKDDFTLFKWKAGRIVGDVILLQRGYATENK